MMEHRFLPPHTERHLPPSSYATTFSPPTAQPPVQIPYSDPFPAGRDPFLPNGRERRLSFSRSGKAWHTPPPQQQHQIPPPPLPPSQQQQQGTNHAPPQYLSQHHHHHHHHQQPPPAQSPLPPPPPLNGSGNMPLPYDPSRRPSLGGSGAGSPPLYGASQPPSFQTRNMPPPSPPQIPPSVSSLPGTAPRGPPTASPFASVRDLAGSSSVHRPAAGMSISSMLGDDTKKPSSSPHGSAIAHSPPSIKSMQPPSPGRARSSSMREAMGRPVRETSPFRTAMMGEPRPSSAAFAHDRMSEPRREPLFGSPLLQRESPHSFRAFQTVSRDDRAAPLNGVGRPNSQPSAPQPPPTQPLPRSVDDIVRRDVGPDMTPGGFRHYSDHKSTPVRDGHMSPRDSSHPRNGIPHSADRPLFHSPQLGREVLQQHQSPATFRNTILSAPPQDERNAPFPTSYPRQSEPPLREPYETRPLHHDQRPSPTTTTTTFQHYEPRRNGSHDRPTPFEEHQRMEMIHRDGHRKGSEGSVTHRLFAGVSPELDRKGRNSPLPQAVQGVQPKQVGPGGDNPGIKMEFGRMFSGIGSGVGGSQTPVAGQSANGTSTPLRGSPSTHLNDGNLVRTAVDHLEEGRNATKPNGRGGRRGGRRPREEMEKDGENADGRHTPSTRGGKRAKTNHHHQHQPELQQDAQEQQPSSFSMLRFNSNPIPPMRNSQTPAHSTTSQHHHGLPRAGAHNIPRKPSVTVKSKELCDQVAHKARQHLGSQLYTTELSLPSPEKAYLLDDMRIRYNTAMKPIPLLEGKENCTYTVRVPRSYLAKSSTKQTAQSSSNAAAPSPSELEMICRRRQLWGAEVYSDDSDVVAAAIHSGWIKGDFGEFNDALKDVLSDGEANGEDTKAKPPSSLLAKPKKPISIPADRDAHITLLILPPLESYASCIQNHIASREWKKTKHDGMSFMIVRVDFVDEGPGTRFWQRTGAAKKARLAAEEAAKREAAAGLLMFAASASAAPPTTATATAGPAASAGGGSGGIVRVGA